MPGRNPNVVRNKLAVDPEIKLVVQKKRKLAVRDENEKLLRLISLKKS